MKNNGFPDARVLLVGVVVITSLAIAINDPLWLAGLLVAVIACLVATGISLYRLWNRLRRYRWLFFVLALVQSITNTSGTVYVQWQEYVLLSSGGLIAAATVLVRIALILAVALLLTIRDAQQLVTGLVQLGIPYELAYMVLLGIRFIPVLVEEFRAAITAIQLRGVDLERIALGNRIRIYTALLMPVVAGTLIKAQRIAIAMEARSFRACRRRTWLEWPRLGLADWLVLLAVLVVGAGCYFLYSGGVRL